MIPVQRIGHATYASPDPERQIAYYTDVVGFTVSARDKDRTVLSTRLGHEVLAIELGSIAQCTRLSFQVASDFDPADAITHFGKQGIACERRSNITPGIADAVVFTDPKGTEIALFAGIDGTAPPRTLIRAWAHPSDFKTWTAVNCTVADDVAHWETVGRSTSLTCTAPGLSYISTGAIGGDDIIALRGKWVTFAALLYVPAGNDGSSGRIDLERLRTLSPRFVGRYEREHA